MNVKNLSVANRLHLLCGLVVVSCLGIGAAVHANSESQESALDDERDANDMALKAEKLTSATLNLRRLEKDFLLHRDLKSSEEFDDYAADMDALIYSIANIDPNIADLRANFESYRDTVDEIVEMYTTIGLTANEGLEGELRNAVHAAETTLSNLESDPLLVKMLMMRRHEKDFIMRGDPKYIDRLDARVEEFSTLLSASDIPAEQRQLIEKNIADYQFDFHIFAKNRLELLETLEEVEHNFSELGASIRGLKMNAERFAMDSIEASERDRERAAWMVFLLIAAISIVATTMTTLISRSIRRPLLNMTADLKAMSGLSARTDAQGGNELDAMQQVLVVLKTEREEADRLRIQNDRVEERARVMRKAERLQIVEELESKVGKLIQSVTNSTDMLVHTSRTLSNDAADSGTEAKNAEASAGAMTDAVASMSQATQELSASIDEIFRQASQSKSTGVQAVTDTERLNNTVQNLRESVTEIFDVVSLINDIAEQTNLLSLNATIEAARAGAAGRGFAVVATEVKQLADQTARSTTSVTQRIDAIRAAVEEASGAIQGVVSHIGDMSNMAESIVDAVETQKVATADIAERAALSTRNSNDVSLSLNAMNATVTRTYDHAQGVQKAAKDLSSDAHALENDAHAFFEKLRS